MNETQSFMDNTDWVERYAWFGAFKTMPGGLSPVRKIKTSVLSSSLSFLQPFSPLNRLFDLSIQMAKSPRSDCSISLLTIMTQRHQQALEMVVVVKAAMVVRVPAVLVGQLMHTRL